MLTSMFRMCLSEDRNLKAQPEHIEGAEEAAIERLVATRWPLLLDGDRVNTKSEDGSRACAAYLEALDSAAQELALDKAARNYRESFTVNYRALFPDEARNYRVDVLEAAFEQYAVIWVNGDKFEFSSEAMRRAEALQRAWWELGTTLERWTKAKEASVETYGQPQRLAVRPTRAELQTALMQLDFAWTSFEHKYIYELIAIEEKARRLLVQAIEQEHRVRLQEVPENNGRPVERNPEYREDQRLLVACIAHLNSVANVSRKGRDDLSVDIFFDAVSTLQRCESADNSKSMGNSENLRAARILATDVVESYEAMRVYLREVESCLERVDPHLCNNSGLVARLVDWEESWEMGTRYMQNEALLTAVCGLVAEVRAAQHLAPSLAVMCEECDVELFLVLPRIMLLCFLAMPQQYKELLRSLLPHRFIQKKDDPTDYEWDAKLTDFVGVFRRAQQAIARARSRKLPDAEVSANVEQGSREAATARMAWELLMQRVALGPGARDSIYSCLASECREEAEAVVECLIHELEPWSMEVQRHCPEDWNQCSAVLVQCLTRGTREQRDDIPFSV